MNAPTPRQQLLAALEVTIAIGQAIREAGPLGIGSGLLYGALMSTLSLESYNRAVALLKDQAIVSETGDHRLVYIGG